MGYTHYYYVAKEVNGANFKKVVKDFKAILPELDHYCKLAGWDGKGKPKITANEINFNGLEKCGHPERGLGITWPAEDKSPKKKGAVSGAWFGGATLNERACGGDCSHESMTLRRVFKPGSYESLDDAGRVFYFCKTAYKPYDFAVVALLVIAKHHLKDDIKVSSDGTDNDWADVKLFVQHHLGYGLEYSIGEGGLTKKAPCIKG